MSSVIGNIIFGIREFVFQTFRGFPVIILGSILAFSVFQSNFNLMLVWIGLFLLTPIVVFGINQIVATLLSNPLNASTNTFWKIFQNDTCRMFGPAGGTSPMLVFPSYWTSIMSFLFFYLFMNAYNIYSMPDQPKSPQESNDRRKSQTMIAMILLTIAAVITFVFRYALTGCETMPGMIMGVLTGSLLGYGWYSFLAACGVGRLDDVFGIKNRILPMQVHSEQAPNMCVPVDQKDD
jgi:hypothetical protein